MEAEGQWHIDLSNHNFHPQQLFLSHLCMTNYQVDIVWSQFHVSTAWLLRWQTQIALGQTDSRCCYLFQ